MFFFIFFDIFNRGLCLIIGNMQKILQIILVRPIQLSWANSIWLIQGLFLYYGPLKYSIIIDQLLWAYLI